MKTFTINGKEYKSKMIDFNLVCDLEDMGVSIVNIDGKDMSLIRGYFGLCAGLTKEKAGKEIEAHLTNGGKFDELMELIKFEMENSDFFRNLKKTAETEDAENQTEESKETDKK